MQNKYSHFTLCYYYCSHANLADDFERFVLHRNGEKATRVDNKRVVISSALHKVVLLYELL